MKLNTKIVFLPLVLLLVSCTAREDLRVSPNNQRHFHDQEEMNTLRSLIRYGEQQGNPAPALNNSRVFVVPIEFKDYPAEEIGMYYNSETVGNTSTTAVAKRFEGDKVGTGRGKEKALQDIKNVYFSSTYDEDGNAVGTCWESLTSYYKKSSYNKLRFNGIVAPWYRPVMDYERPEDTWATAAEWASTSELAAAVLATDIIAYYSNETEKNYLELEKEDGTKFKDGKDFLKYFDSDGDGFFDYISMVYSAPFYATNVANGEYKKPINNDIFWAYCGGISGKDDGKVDAPVVNKYSFFSYYTFVEAGKLEINEELETEKTRPWTCQEISDGVPMDAHTLIHESGHAIGLPDFYDTSYSGKLPAGKVDMMDHNIGDHNSYTKTQLGWVDPIVVTGPTQVSIRSFTETGDCIMVPYRGFYKDHPERGNSTMIEYLAIELYTPTGVNKADSEHSYRGDYPKCPSIPGLKIYHVDSRLGVFNTTKFIDFTESISGSYPTWTRIASTNSDNDHVEDFWQLQFLNRDSEKMSTLVENASLFQAGDTFNDDNNYGDFIMNEVTKDKEEEIPFGYKITIKECNENGATILFEATQY